MSADRAAGDWFRSTLPMLLLRQLADQPMHGYGLMEGLRASGFDVKGATVYPHLNRLHDDGMIVSEWQAPETGPARKIMTITADGETYLRELSGQWAAFRNQIDAAMSGPVTPSATDEEETE